MSKDLVAEIFNSELPEEYVKTINAQNLYIAIKRNGLESSADIIAISTPEQVQLLLDFDLWHKDQFDEDNFWQWMALPDAIEDLDLLKKIFKSFDLKLIALVLGRYVESYYSDEKTDEGEPGFYTPDRGHTWIKLNIEDPDRNFYLGRLLASIFEMNPDLFYQILSVPTVTTLSILEEESYQDAIKRLACEGIPEYDLAADAHKEIYNAEIKELLKTTNLDIRKDINTLEIVTWNKDHYQYFSELKDLSNIEVELSFILNSAIVFFSVVKSDIDEMTKLVAKIKGAINIGLEKLNNLGYTPKESYEKLGLVIIYRYGLTELNTLKKHINYKDKTKLENSIHNPEMFGIIAGVNQLFCEQPNYIENGKLIDIAGELESGYKEIKSCVEIEFLKNKLIEYFNSHI